MKWKRRLHTRDHARKKDLFRYDWEGENSNWRIYVDHLGASLYRVSRYGCQTWVGTFKLLRDAKEVSEFADTKIVY